MSTPLPLTRGQHYLAAEAYVAQAYVEELEYARLLLARAQVHATLATVDEQVYADARKRAQSARETERRELAESESAA